MQMCGTAIKEKDIISFKEKKKMKGKREERNYVIIL